MKRFSRCRLLSVAGLLFLTTAPAAQAQFKALPPPAKIAYFMVTVCTALETAGVPLPAQSPEQMQKAATQLDQQARSLGQQLGHGQDQVEAQIKMRRDELLASLHDPDPVKSKHASDQTSRLAPQCLTLVGSDVMKFLGQR